jgi:hypothetical protein
MGCASAKEGQIKPDERVLGNSSYTKTLTTQILGLVKSIKRMQVEFNREIHIVTM